MGDPDPRVRFPTSIPTSILTTTHGLSLLVSSLNHSPFKKHFSSPFKSELLRQVETEGTIEEAEEGNTGKDNLEEIAEVEEEQADAANTEDAVDLVHQHQS
jgi:hypothetical protein